MATMECVNPLSVHCSFVAEGLTQAMEILSLSEADMRVHVMQGWTSSPGRSDLVLADLAAMYLSQAPPYNVSVCQCALGG